MKYNLFAACLVLLGIGACTDQHTTRQQLDGFIYCSEGSPGSFNPQMDTSGTTADATAHQIYDRLIEFDPHTNKLEPALAESWAISSDGLTYTFQLRKKVSFHQTSYFTPSRYFNADDVIFSIDRWRLDDHPYHRVSGGVYPYFVSLGLTSIVASVERINGYRIEIKLTRPDSSFLANLATDFAVILSAEYAQQLLDDGHPEQIDQLPIGTGPFVFESYRKGRYIRYHKNENYWHHEVSINQLIFDITPASSTRLAKLLTGECDAIAFPAYPDLNIIKSRANLQVDEKPGLNVGFWAFNTQVEPFNNPLVRKALAMAIDKDTLINTVYSDSAVRARSLLPPTSWAYQASAKDSSYNPVLARELLDEAGIPEGFTFDIWALPIERAYNPNARKMAELIKGYLKQVGVNVNVVSYEWSTFRQRLREGKHDTVLIGWNADNADPDNFYRPLLSCAAIASGTNRSNWCNEEYDSLIDQALLYSEPEVRSLFYQMANTILSDEMPLVPIAHAYRYQAYQNRLKNFDINPFGGIKLGDVEKVR
ncbi:ABC transporter substrate-binding protein [Neptunicella marina]|uniref:ABC transporter substrate-binding protein n=1 Tax=Neptunicella marina TaxID=2125989 RepID=A0A8J6IS36_9ALTE|nr:ABC transporter substrate-binding protein [Neptunicella marina]MBC3766435.1 ABC transporter substrate-binding protein [Neptunicella marina]